MTPKCTTPIFLFGGGNIMMLGFFFVVDGKMNAAKQREFLNQNLKDNDTKHIARMQWLHEGKAEQIA